MGTKHKSHSPRLNSSMAEYHNNTNPAVYYILPATTLTPNQCDQIMRPCLMDRMAAAGYNRSFPRAIISTPSKYYGLNLTDMYTKQGIQHLLMMLQYRHSFIVFELLPPPPCVHSFPTSLLPPSSYLSNCHCCPP